MIFYIKKQKRVVENSLWRNEVNSPILHIFVVYKNQSQSKAFLNACLRQAGSEYVDFIWADNTFPSAAPPVSENRLKVHQSEKNLGYIGIVSDLIEKRKIDPSNYQYVIVSNTDLQFGTDDFYRRLMQSKIPMDCGLLGPSIQSARTDKESNPFLAVRPSRQRMNFYKKVFSSNVSSGLYQLAAFSKDRLLSSGGRKQKNAPLNMQFVYAVHGSCFIFTRKFFMKGLRISYPCFLYGEEIHFAELCRQRELKVVFAPDLKILHQEHGAIGVRNLFFNPDLHRFRKDSSRFLCDQYFSEKGL